MKYHVEYTVSMDVEAETELDAQTKAMVASGLLGSDADIPANIKPKGLLDIKCFKRLTKEDIVEQYGVVE